jgi:hypothetical protein
MKRLLKHKSVAVLVAAALILALGMAVETARAGAPVGSYWNGACTASTVHSCSTFQTAFNMIQAGKIAVADIVNNTIIGLKLDLSTPPTGAYAYGYQGLSDTAVKSLCSGENLQDTDCAKLGPGDGRFTGNLYATSATIPAINQNGETLDINGNIDQTGNFVSTGSVTAGNAVFGGLVTTGQSVCAGMTFAQCSATESAYPDSITAAGNVFSQGYGIFPDGVASGGTGSNVKLKWRVLTGTTGSGATTIVPTPWTTIISMNCLIDADPTGHSHWATPGDAIGAGTYYFAVYESEGTIYIYDATAAMYSKPYRCLVFYY